jgi:sugar lactone lactonase YvrE
MQLKIATLAAFFVFTLIFSQSAMAASYPYVGSFGSQGLVKTGSFTYPQYAAVDESGNIYVTDLGNARVQKFDNDGEFLHSWGSKGTGKSEFHAPAGIAIGGSYVYVADHELNVIKKFDLNGNFISSWGSTGTEAGKLKLPNGIAVSKDDFVYVVDTANARVQKFDSSGKFVSIIGSSGTGDGKFLTPLGIAVDSDGNIFVADSGNSRIQKFNSNGVFVVSYNAASGGIKISPDGIDVDSSGNIIVADAGGSRVVVLDKDGNTVTSFGKAGSGNSQFKLPKDVALDSDGDLFVVDSSNHRIQKFGSKDTQTASTTTQTTEIKTPQKPVANDLKKPTVNPPKDLYVEASGGLTRVSIGQAIANDESGIKSITSNAPEEFPLGITTVIWTAIDNAGNMGIATQTITVGDSTPPVISGLTDITLEANGVQNTANLGNPTVNDQVGVLSITNDAPETFSLGETTITWTAVDVAKNEATYTQTVTVVDTKPPKVRAPVAITSEATSLDQNIVALGEPSITDNSELSSITNDAPTFFPLGQTTITWTAIDVAGNVGSATQKVTIIDTTAPIISKVAELNVEAISEKQNPVTLVAPNATDVQAITITNDAPTFFPLGQTTITWTAKDYSGNNSTTSQIISIIDTSAPDLIVPVDIIQEATGKTGNIVSLGEPTATDATGVSSISHNGPSDYPFGSTIITWTATDSFGNSISKNQNVTIIDTTKPNISAPLDVTFEATNLDQNIISLGEPKTSDLVEVQSITNDSPEAFKLGQTVITWTVTDSSGNTNTATQLITVSDGTAPIISAPANITSEATGRDGTMLSIGKAEATDAIGVDTITNDAPETFPLGETIVTWTATDTVGNTSTATQTVTVLDTTSPTITAPADIVSEATSSSENAVILSLPIASDSVSDVTITNDAPSSFPLGETIVTWTATDEAGNLATTTQKVTITDTTSPTITAPADITQEATSKLENTVTLETPSVSDNVGIETITNDAPELFPVGETVVTWTAMDNSGNTESVSQRIILVDTVPPKFTRLADITVEATSKDSNEVSLTIPNVFDILDIISLDNDAPKQFSLGETTVTWTATDEAGNSATSSQRIIIQDTTIPIITAPVNITQEADSFEGNSVSLGKADANDLVEINTITNDAPESFKLGETLITWTATDSSGNVATATQKVTITDTTAPKITPPESLTVEATSLSENHISLSLPSAVDAVSEVFITNDAPSVFPLGETIVTWTATDEAENSASITQTITVVDTTAPSLVIPENVVADALSLKTPVSLGVASATDLTDDMPNITNDAPSMFPLGETVITWSVEDRFGNTLTKTQTVTVEACGKPESSYNVILGKEDDDILVGTNLADLIISLGGDDIITAEKGNDCVLAGDGDDIIYGNEGNDYINGGDGADIIKGQSGEDILIGLTGIDIIDGGDDSDSCIVSEHDDDILIKCE